MPQEHSPSPTPERAVYGFVLYQISLLSFGLYLVWAYVPKSVLDSVGLTYWPHKYWAVALPVYLCVGIVLSYVAYTGVIFLTTPKLSDVRTITDEHALYEDETVPYQYHRDAIPPLQDVDISTINRVMYLQRDQSL